MKVTIHQPDYLPWIGFFYKWLYSDLFIIYDDAQYIKGGWQSRDKIRIAEKEQWITVPVITKGRLGQLISETEINYATDWVRVHLNTMKTYYGKSPYFAEIFPKLEDIYLKKHRKLVDFNVELLNLAAQSLGISVPVKYSSEFKITSFRTQKVIDLLKAVKCTEYIAGQGAKEYMDEHPFEKENIKIYYPEISDIRSKFSTIKTEDIGLSVIHYLFNYSSKSENI